MFFPRVETVNKQEYNQLMHIPRQEKEALGQKGSTERTLPFGSTASYCDSKSMISNP